MLGCMQILAGYVDYTPDGKKDVPHNNVLTHSGTTHNNYMPWMLPYTDNKYSVLNLWRLDIFVFLFTAIAHFNHCDSM